MSAICSFPCVFLTKILLVCLVWSSCKGELRHLYSSPAVIRVIKSRRFNWSPGGWGAHVVRTGEKRYPCRVLVRNSEGQRPWWRWQDDIKLGLNTNKSWGFGLDFYCAGKGQMAGFCKPDCELPCLKVPEISWAAKEFLASQERFLLHGVHIFLTCTTAATLSILWKLPITKFLMHFAQSALCAFFC